MFTLLRYLSTGWRDQPVRQPPNPAAAYAEALQAGWVPPPVEAQAMPVRPADRPEAEVLTLLNRVYRHQQC